jgi:hypothetical protein
VVLLFLRRLELLRLDKLREAAGRGRLVYKHVWVVDIAGLSLGMLLSKENRAMMSHVGAELSIAYPESMAKTFIVNAPRLFAGVWRALKPLMDPVAAAKFTVLGPLSGSAAGQQALLDAGVDPEVVEARCGARPKTCKS